MNIREYNPDKDKKAAHRIWHEVGWISDAQGEKAMDTFLSACHVLVSDINDKPECLVASTPGAIHYLNEELTLTAVTAVTTSHIARKQGLAKRLTARLIADAVSEGAEVAGLGMFEQGFYNRLGFGTGNYEHWIGFDPAQLAIKKRARIPRRLTKKDWKQVHAAMVARKKRHGACNLLRPKIIKGEMSFSKSHTGLGYFDGKNGELTHFIWFETEGEHGPYDIHAMAYQNWDQFLELMAVVKNLGDQVHRISMREPAEIQIQDLLKQPFRSRNLTKKSRFEAKNRAVAYWQLRICNLQACLEKTRLRNDGVRFNLKLHDPIAEYLPEDAPWRGVGGDYVITLGRESNAKPDTDDSLPTLTASVGAFTRLWLGVRPASGLAVSDNLTGPEDLLQTLDAVLCLPTPKTDWDF